MIYCEYYGRRKKRLEYTLHAIDDEIKKKETIINNSKKESHKLSFEHRLKGAHLQLNAQIYDAGNDTYYLERAKKSPYFGRIDFLPVNESIPINIYIGKMGITNNNQDIVKDWRAPVCGLYYGNEL